MQDKTVDSRALIEQVLNKDTSLWQEYPHIEAELAQWMGWLDAIPWMARHNPEIMQWADEIAGSGRFDTAVLLGMGGSSLAAEVFGQVFGTRDGRPELCVLDTTSPSQLMALELDISRCLFIVASKSGSTVESLDLYAWFADKLQDLGREPGTHCVAITDADSWLHQHATGNNFLKVFLNPADIGGRFSALSYFGLVPAALIGLDLDKLLAHARGFQRALTRDQDAELIVGCARMLAEQEARGANKLCIQLSPSILSLGDWIEQLVAESLGKHGRGILPVVDNHFAGPGVRVAVTLDGDPIPDCDAHWSWTLSSVHDLGGEFFRWQLITVISAGLMGVNPFDQPDVEQTKAAARDLVGGRGQFAPSVVFEDAANVVFRMSGSERQTAATLKAVMVDFHKACQGRNYLAILAYLPRNRAIQQRLKQLAGHLSQTLNMTVTIGFGPRYLHSTGQFHKGGPTDGCFLQLVEHDMPAIPVPGRGYGFDRLHRAQADGDYSVLESRGQCIMRIALKGDRLDALDKLVRATVDPGSNS